MTKEKTLIYKANTGWFIVNKSLSSFPFEGCQRVLNSMPQKLLIFLIIDSCTIKFFFFWGGGGGGGERMGGGWGGG